MRVQYLFALLATAVFAAATSSCNEHAGREEGTVKPPETQPSARTRDKPADADIKAALLREIAIDRVAPIEAIEIAVTDGIVELTGTVDNILAKARAVRLAEGVRGVRAVSDRIAVTPGDRPDDAITKDVERALRADPATEALGIEVKVSDQVVSLSGETQSWAERDLAQIVAERVKGVKEVDNHVEVSIETARPDSEIARDIERRLRWDTLVDDALIQVEVTGGTVELKGVVGSASEKRRAAYDAWVAGVEEVLSDRLDVERWARDDDLRKGKYEAKSDQEIVDALQFAATLDPRVKSYNIDITSESGMVTLSGMVDNLRARNAAEQLALDTVGVAGVRNQLKVAPRTREGERELEAEVKDALFRNPITEGYEIAVGVADGVVTLNGTVDSYAEKAEAREVAEGIVGAVRVVNLLNVAYEKASYTYDPYLAPLSPYVSTYTDYTHRRPLGSDAEIKAAIERELKWSPFINADQITVAVVHGDATLTGRVDSWRERGAAIENAFEGGAIRVNAEKLIVAP